MLLPRALLPCDTPPCYCPVCHCPATANARVRTWPTKACSLDAVVVRGVCYCPVLLPCATANTWHVRGPQKPAPLMQLVAWQETESLRHT